MKKLTKEHWDSQYQQGKWDHLLSASEAKRNNVIGEFCRKYHDHPTILDVGCGFGNLVQYLTFQTYLGMDLSAVPLPPDPPPLVQFIAQSAEEFHTDRKFDLIIFNEILYYVEAFEILKKFGQFLSPNGFFIISLWVHPKTILLWEEVQRRYDALEKTEVRDEASGNRWNIGIFQLRSANPSFPRMVSA